METHNIDRVINEIEEDIEQREVNMQETDPHILAMDLIHEIIGGEADKEHIKASFEDVGIYQPDDLLFIDPDNIVDDEGPDDLTPIQYKKLSAIIKWYTELEPADQTSSIILSQLNQQELKRFIIQNKREKTSQGVPQQIKFEDSKSMGSQTNTSKSLGVLNFQKGVKRVTSEFPTFTKDNQWLTWITTAETIATTQLVSNIFDPKYVPSDQEEVEVYDLQNAYIFGVLLLKLKTSKSSLIVRNHLKTKDAHNCLKDLREAYEDGTTGLLTTEVLEDRLKDFKLSSKWDKPLEHFLDTWSHKLMTLEQTQEEPVSSRDRRKWLTAAIRGHPELKAAVDNSNTIEATLHTLLHDKSQIKKKLDWHQFYTLVLNKAQMIDSLAKKQKAQKRSTNNTNRSNNGNTNNRPPRNDKWYIEPEKWKKMSKKQKDEHCEKARKARAKAKADNNNGSNTQSRQANQAQSSDADSTSTPSVQNTTTSDVSGSQISDLLGDGETRQSHVCRRQCNLNKQTSHKGSLIDSGCNGGMAGSDVRIIEEGTGNPVDITGIGDTELNHVQICTAAGLIQTQQGPIIGIFHQYANYGKGNTIHSSLQLGANGLDVNEKPKGFPGGRQTIITPEGYVIPLRIRHGLAYMDMVPPSDHQLQNLEHVFFTSDTEWSPDIIDNESERTETESDTEDTVYLINRNVQTPHTIAETQPEGFINKKVDYNLLKPFFNFAPISRIRNTLKNTTQWFRAENRGTMRKHTKARFPGANVPRLAEKYAFDTWDSNTPAAATGLPKHNGCQMVTLYTGVTSKCTYIYPMGSKDELPDTMKDFIRSHGAPISFVSDHASVNISEEVIKLLREFRIGASNTSEPDYQNQNPAERRIQDIKASTQQVMDRTGTPNQYWLMCTLHVCDLYNHMSLDSLSHKTPLEAATNLKPDISAFLHYHWWQPVYFQAKGETFPTTKERMGRWLGVARNVGDALTYYVLAQDTKELVIRSVLRAANEVETQNIRANPAFEAGEMEQDSGQASPLQLQSIMPKPDLVSEHSPSTAKLPRFSPEELIGTTFIREQEDGQKLRAKIIRKIEDQDANNHQNLKFLLKLGDGSLEEIIAYTELSDAVEKQIDLEINDQDKLWTYRSIVSHQGPLKRGDKDYKGSQWNIRVEWEDGTMTDEPLNMVMKDDPICIAKYAAENDLLDLPGWKRVKQFAKRKKILNRMLKHSMNKAFSTAPIYMFGVRVPRNHKEAVQLDTENGNTKWQDAEKTEIAQLQEYQTFHNVGRGKQIPVGFKKIRCRMIYACKHDLRHKARFVAGGHLTDTPKDVCYSGVVTLKTMRLALVAGEVNGLKVGVGDIGNAYLEAYTNEKVCFIAGGEFGELEGCLLIIVKALYGLKSSGARFHDKLADTLRDMGFKQCLADADLWMREQEDHYEYICVYVDDLMVIMKHPTKFFDILINEYKYKLKGVGEPQYHLGGNFGRDPDGVLYWSARTYIDKSLGNYERLFGALPKKMGSPMEKGDSPELDQTPELQPQQAKIYMSLIGQLQWCITLGRYDIAVGVATLSRFRACPRDGHLKRLHRIYGYLRKHPDAAIRFRTKIPNNEKYYKMDKHDWMNTVYGDIKDSDDDKMFPKPKGKKLRTTCFVDANLMHCKVTGKSMTGILHLVNQTPVDWFSKLQPTVETATYGSEFVAAKIATEQIMDLRITLKSMGIPIDGQSWLMGDNQSVITSSTIPHSTLNKRWNALAYHRVRASVAAEILKFCYVNSKQNPADPMTKFLAHHEFWPLVKPVLFRRGN